MNLFSAGVRTAQVCFATSALMVLLLSLGDSVIAQSGSPARAVSAFARDGVESPGDAATRCAALNLEQIVSRLEERNRERAEALREYEGSRTYRLRYSGFPGSKDAEMLVQMNFRAPASKRFKILSQTGSKFIIDHVLTKLLQSEEETLQEENHRRSALTRDNYDFFLKEYEQDAGCERYVLGVIPKNKNKFLYQGRIWVDATDFAVTRIEGEPARNPSFWIKKTSIHHEYMKIGNFWLPAKNRTESLIRLGGKALLTIDYTNYKIISVAPVGKSHDARLERMGTESPLVGR